MKTIALLIVCGVIFTLNLTGQIKKNRNPLYDQGNDSLKIAPYFEDHGYSKFYKKFDLPDNIIINPDLNFWGKNFKIESPEIKRSYDKTFSEKFPGSNKFYAKRPYLINPDDKFFIKKPDTSARYYLIIKDPITNWIIN
jgi:hypothetical protein